VCISKTVDVAGYVEYLWYVPSENSANLNYQGINLRYTSIRDFKSLYVMDCIFFSIMPKKIRTNLILQPAANIFFERHKTSKHNIKQPKFLILVFV